MQDYPGAPGTARPGNAGTAVPAACGGAAVQPLPPAPDHTRSSAMPMPLAPDHNRSRAAPMPMPQAPGHQRSDAASMASPGHAACGPVTAGRSVPMATAPVPAQAGRRLQAVLPRVPATPGTLIYTQAHRLNRHFRLTPHHSRLTPRHSRESGNPRPPVATGGPPGGYAPATHAASTETRADHLSHSVTHQGHPAIQVPSRPPPVTAGTGGPHPRHSRAPPTPARRKPTLRRPRPFLMKVANLIR